MPLLTVSHLRKRFNLEAGFFARFGRFVNAVNDVSFSIGANETYGLVGESGCGKTTTARLLVRMYEADGGSILYHRSLWGFSPNDKKNAQFCAFSTLQTPKGAQKSGVFAVKGRKNPQVPQAHRETGPAEVAALRKAELRRYREKVKYVFQDPARSLNPRMSVYEVLVSGPRWSAPYRKAGEKQLRREAASVLEEVGLSAADLDLRPSEFSGGQRQRISIARGILMRPELLICDEVVSALDVSIQGQILNLLLDIRQKREIAFLFIAHDLKVACYFCDRIGVMYRGELMEEASAGELYRRGLHPYTRLLFSSATGGKPPPPLHPAALPSAAQTPASGRIPLPPSAGGIPPATPPPAFPEETRCAFAERCPRSRGRCFGEKPPMREIGAGHTIRCFDC